MRDKSKSIEELDAAVERLRELLRLNYMIGAVRRCAGDFSENPKSNRLDDAVGTSSSAQAQATVSLIKGYSQRLASPVGLKHAGPSDLRIHGQRGKHNATVIVDTAAQPFVVIEEPVTPIEV